jgi:hemoglobin
MRRRVFSTLIMAAAIVSATVLPGAAQDQSTTTPPARSLYARLGGYDFVAKFVDTAFPRVARHPQLRRLFQGHSQDSQMRQRQLIVDALCQAVGGPCAYTGRAMKSVHTGLGITADDWTVFIGILTGTLEELKVGPPERKEFLDLLDQRFKAGVVEKG